MLSVSHKSSSDSDAKSAAHVDRKTANQQNNNRIQTKSEARNDGTASLQRVMQNGSNGLSTAIDPPIQTKLSVGKPDDKYEVEAESKADKVMSMAQPVSESVQPKPRAGAVARMVQSQAKDEKVLHMQPVEEKELQARSQEKEELVQRKPEKEKPDIQAQAMEQEELQRKSGPGSASSEAGASYESSLTATKGSGDTLPGSVRSYMEPRFEADFSDVRVHTNSEAAELSQNINAQAFTHGRDIYFNDGTYNPDSSRGKHLIAHELTHTIQQGAAVQTQSKSNDTTASSSNRVQRSWLGDAASWVGDRVSGAAEWAGDSLESGKDWLMGWLKERVVDVPGYKLLTVVLNKDPLTGSHVPRNGRNFIEAGLDIIPNGKSFKRKLQEQGTFDKAVKWLDGELTKLEDVSAGTITANFHKFWNSISLIDVRHPKKVLKDLLRIFSNPINRIIQFAREVAARLLEIVKDYLLSKVVDFIKRKQSPTFYPLLRVVLGKDPISGEEVDRSGKNILRGFIKLHPDGNKQLRKMKETGSFGRAVKWIDQSILRIQKIATGLRSAFLSIWDAITDINTLMNPIGTFERVYNKFRSPLGELADFMWTVGEKILTFIKDALLSRLSAFAHNTTGYPLLTVLLGKDPFTGENVPRTLENIIKGFFSLTENGEEKFKKLKESGAIARTKAWMSGAIERLNITWEYITGLFKTAWERLTIDALMQPIKAFMGIVKLFAPPIRRLVNFVGEVVKKVIEIVLQLMNFPANLIGSMFQKTVAVFGLIKSDPIGFIKNLLRGLKQGFRQFFGNIGKHLLGGLTDWLFGTLEEAGITPPQDLSLKSILGLVMQILGITKDHIFDRIAEKIGRKKMERIRGFMDKLQGVWSFVKDVMTRGPVAIWKYVQEKISNLWNLVFEQVKSWIMEKIITKVTTKLLSMLDPSGVMAVVNSFIAIYNAIESFVAYFTKMLRMVNRFVDGVAAIARGNLAPAANKLEASLSKGIPIAIGFLANQVGLSGLGKKIGKMIGAVRAKVDGAIDWLIEKAMKAGGAVLNMGKSALGAVTDWWKSRREVRTQDSKQHELFFEGSGTTARLMIASDPQPYISYLDSLKGTNNLTEEQITPAKSKAQQVEEAKSKTVSDEEQQDHGAEINNLIDELVDKTSKIPLNSAGGTNTPALYGPIRQGFGTLARVGYLQAPHNEGSSPSVTNTDEYNSINLRRKGGGAYYVKGHLLNDNLGGPGTTWSNLTPLTVKANADHKTKFENPVKKAVNGTEARGVNPKEAKGYVRDFSVRAIYGRSIPNTYNTLTNEETDETPPGLSDDINPFDVARLLRAEQYVPTRLVCKAQIKCKGADKEERLNETITNDIQYGQLSNYSLKENPRQDYVLSKHINFEAETKQKAVEELVELSAIGPARAIRIYNGLVESGRIYNYKKQIGITKKTIEKNNPGYRIIGGTYNR